MKKNLLRNTLCTVILVFPLVANAQWVQTCGPTGSINALAVIGSNLFAGTEGGGVFISINNGTSWTAVNLGLSIISVDALTTSNGYLFAGIHNFETHESDIWRSTDNGTSWTSALSYFSNHEVSALAVSGDNIFVGTWEGVIFLSANNGTSWKAVNSSLKNVDITALTVSGGNVFAGTHNVGIWRRSVPNFSGVVDNHPEQLIVNKMDFRIIPPGISGSKVTIAFSLLQSEQVSIKVYTLSGHAIASLVNKTCASGFHSLNWETRNVATGCYLMSIKASNDNFIKRMLLVS